MTRQLTLLLLTLACALPAQAGLRIFACEPEWGALARELAGPDAHIDVATPAQQDPHHVQARPSLLAQVRRADLLVCNGADLEVGWLPLLLQRAGNPAIQPGQPGHFLAADHVHLLDLPGRIDRSQGDVHPQGNPHLHLDPGRLRQVAVALAARLRQVDAGHAATYRAQADRFIERWDAATRKWRGQAQALRDLPVLVVHTEWRYLFEWTGMRAVAHLEDKPGIPPSSNHLAKVLQKAEQEKPVAILTAPGRSTRGPDWLHARSGIAVLQLPYTVGGNERADDLFALFDETLRLLMTLQR